MQWLSGRKNFLGACICAIAVICSGYISVVVADTYKLYINKNDDPNNVIEFEESLNVEVKHTPEGMELNIPDVVINMRCISANSSDKTKCRFGVESSTGSSSSSGSSGSSSSSSSSGSSGASSSGSSSSGSSGAGPDDGVVDSVGNCKTSAIQKCLKYDFGSGGEHNRGNTYRSFVIPGQVVSMPFTVVEGKFSGAVQRTFTSVTGESDGAYPRFWLSAEPSGRAAQPDLHASGRV